ncbi:hypothetical protein V6Z11_A08G212900 [Gossypium hirsutum]
MGTDWSNGYDRRKIHWASLQNKSYPARCEHIAQCGQTEESTMSCLVVGSPVKTGGWKAGFDKI